MRVACHWRTTPSTLPTGCQETGTCHSACSSCPPSFTRGTPPTPPCRAQQWEEGRQGKGTRWRGRKLRALHFKTPAQKVRTTLDPHPPPRLHAPQGSNTKTAVSAVRPCPPLPGLALGAPARSAGPHGACGRDGQGPHSSRASPSVPAPPSGPAESSPIRPPLESGPDGLAAWRPAGGDRTLKRGGPRSARWNYGKSGKKQNKRRPLPRGATPGYAPLRLCPQTAARPPP